MWLPSFVLVAVKHVLCCCRSPQGLHDTGNDPVRWARFLSEIVRRISILCPKSVTFAYEEISSRYVALACKANGQYLLAILNS